MENVDLNDFNEQMQKELSIQKPRTVKFSSASVDGVNYSINVNIENGDFLGIINGVVEKGGIWGRSEERQEYFFIPWPCAAVTVSI